MASIADEIFGLLEELIAIPGVTGFEDAVRDKLVTLLPASGITVGSDNMGNLYATLTSSDSGDNKPKVMLCAHMDEVGFVVSSIDSEGFIYLYPLGGVPDYLGPGLWVRIHGSGGDIYGSVGIHPPHLPVTGNREIFVDVGASSRQEVLDMGIEVGTSVTFARDFRRLKGDRVMGRCLDDRVGCAILVALLRHLAGKKVGASITGVFSSTEEHGMLPGSGPAPVTGSRGALVAAMNLKPDFAIVMDSMVCSDIPGIPRHMRQIRLGGGAALRLVDDLAIMRPRMRLFLQNVARNNNIQIQQGVSRSYTDTSVIQLADVPVATLGIPLRYAHSPGQIADLGDMAGIFNFVSAIVQNISQYFSG
ncbi:M42 family metallopeptidase [Desulfotruncus alcoholivorax]|uniref:M42 family metallopeptidase n=1 Tax=Desulfotruncus alcoholivorax TaxID=265477 RepID=UPI000422D81B|nr:M42 family metallopeptidase [Desulfotruncus alcoholivorax]